MMKVVHEPSGQFLVISARRARAWLELGMIEKTGDNVCRWNLAFWASDQGNAESAFELAAARFDLRVYPP